MSIPDPTAGPPDTAGQLPDDAATLKRVVLELLASLHQQRLENDTLRRRLDALLRRLYGPRGERFDPSQLLLFAQTADADVTGPPADTTPPPPPPRRCRPHGRRRLPEDLPRQSQHHQLTEAERICARCGGLRRDIGADRSEQLEYRPASLFVVEHFVHKYACPCCAAPPDATGQAAEPSESPIMPPYEPPVPDAAVPASADAAATTGLAAAPSPQPAATAVPVVIAAARPAPPIAKGLPGPGLLAHLIVSKYTDHLPLHRLERIYERQGVFLHRSTLSDWLAASASLLRPLYERKVQAVLQSRSLHTDDTTVKLQDPLTHQLSTARLWCYLGDVDRPYNVFDFTATRKRDGPQRFLGGYRGYLHADAFSGYDGLYLPEPPTSRARIVEVACNAHARRKFYEARLSDALRAHQALAYYRQLYELERAAKDFSDEQRLAMRQDLAVPILGQFRTWLEAERPAVLPKSPTGEAVGYALRNWAALCRYTEAGFLSIDNNAAEREMKRIAIGRKNWLSVGSARGGATAAVLMSFTSTCARLGVEPWAYLEDVLRRLPSLPSAQLGELLADRWLAARRAGMAGQPAVTPSATSPSTGSGS